MINNYNLEAGNMKRILIFILSVTMLIPVTPVVAEVKEKVFHVSPSGSDVNDGSEQRPLATLEGVRLLVRRQEKNVPIRVVFHEGEYRFSKGVNFDEMDSGTEDARITYEAAEGEKVIFKGSVKLDTTQFQPVKDQSVLERIPKEARDKVGQLDLKKQGITSLPEFIPNTSSEALGGENIAFYLDGKEQPIAQWPNGNGNYTSWVKVIDKGTATFTTSYGNGAIIQYAEQNPSRWTTAKDFYIGGYPGKDYRYERILGKSVDPENKTVTMAYGSNYGFVNDEAKRWKAFNLLEELDTPGEWYVDRDTLMLYYYPAYSMTNAKFEMALLRENFITMTGVSHITIRGIDFTQTCATAIELKNKCDDIIVENCNFSYIGQKAVFAHGSTRGTLENSNRNIIDGVKNCHIRDNDFYYIGSSAVELTGGNRDTLERGENHITNNYIYQPATITKNSPAISIYGVGNFVEHNVVHYATFHALNFNGNDHTIRYNEFFNVGREQFDAGVIYAGRSLVNHGTEVAYNLVHDYIRTDEKIGYDVLGIFLDDCYSGTIIHHNVFLRGAAGIQVGGGVDNNVYSNILLEIKDNNFNTDNRGEAWESVKDYGFEPVLKNVVNNPAYLSRYPTMKYFANNLEFPWPPYRNRIVGNLTMKPTNFNARMQELGTIENNVVVSELSDFVNPEALDYRVKSNSETAKQLPDILTEEFDIDKIGLQINQNRKELIKPDSQNSSFRKLYPQNGATGIDVRNLTLSWEDAKHADKYKVTIATDPEMKNVVYTKEVHYNFVNVEGLETGLKTYYWTVEAINISRQMKSTWKSSGVPFAFTTALYDVLYKEELGKLIEECEMILNGIVEGDNVGEYKEGTRKAFEESLNYAKELYEKRKGEIKQEQLDAAVLELDRSKSAALGNVNVGYKNIDYMLESPDDWAVLEKPVTIKDGELTLAAAELTDNQACYNVEPEKYEILAFKAKVDFPATGSAWAAFSMRQQEDHKKIYHSSGYCIVVKPNMMELQRYPGGVLVTANNDTLKDGEWHDYEFGVLDKANGVQVIFKVDGKKVFDFIDVDAPVRNNGKFGIFAPKNHSVMLKGADAVPEGPVYLDGRHQAESKPEELNISELFVEKGSWTATGGNISWTDSGLSFISDEKSNILSYAENIAGNKILNFDASFNPGEQYQGIGLRIADEKELPWRTDGYLVVVKRDALELQRFKNGKNEMLSIVDNEYIPEGQKVNIRFGAYEADTDIRIVFYVDGKRVFDCLDYNPVWDEGKFALYDMSQKGLNLYPESNVPVEYGKPVIVERTGTVYYAGQSGIYSGKGSWEKEKAGYDGIDLYVSSSPDASGRWSFSVQPGIYKVYYWNPVLVDGDKNATFILYISGETDTRYMKVDFSRGNANWKDMGVYYASDGTMDLTITGSGEGKIAAGAVRIVKTNADEQKISHLFEKAPGAVVLKVDSQKAFIHRETYEIPDVSPTVVNNTTLVPLRFISEAFGGKVQWDSERSAAIVTIGSYEISFTDNGKHYTLNGQVKDIEQGAEIINGRMMIPLRVVSEAIGKEVFWDDRGLIIIAEKIELNIQNDSDIIESALKALTN